MTDADGIRATPVDVRVEHRDGIPVLVKRASDQAARDRLAHEAAVLVQARHPGVVELVAGPGSGAGDEDGDLVLRWIGTRTLADLRAPSAVEVAVHLAAVAATIADLHDRGVVHGRVTADHVVLDGDGRPVLCGFGEASTAADTRHPRTEDVAGLGRLLGALLERSPGTRRPDRGTRDQRRALAALAASATARDVARRPSARALAERVAAIGPGGRPDPPAAAPSPSGPEVGSAGDPADDDALEHLRRVLDDDRPRRPRPPRPFPTSRLVAGLGALVALVIAVGALVRSGGGDDVAGRDPRPAVSPTIPGSSSTTGTPPDQRLDTRPVAELDGRRFAVGDPGDVVAVGDWTCVGRPLAAVLRPTTGDVFVFTSWAPPGGRVEAASLGRVPGAVALRPGPDPGCGGLVAVLTDGTTVPVPIPGAAP